MCRTASAMVSTAFTSHRVSMAVEFGWQRNRREIFSSDDRSPAARLTRHEADRACIGLSSSAVQLVVSNKITRQSIRSQVAWTPGDLERHCVGLISTLTAASTSPLSSSGRSGLSIDTVSTSPALIPAMFRRAASSCRVVPPDGHAGSGPPLLETAAEAGRRLATPEVPLPVLWDEPVLVIGGMAPGALLNPLAARRWSRKDVTEATGYVAGRRPPLRPNGPVDQRPQALQTSRG